MTLAPFLSELSRQHPKQHCYDMGYDCAIKGPNSHNCDFRLFATPDQTRAWEQGEMDGELQAHHVS